jgi:hypothetical protein
VFFSCMSWVADTRRFWYQSCKIQIADTKNTILSQSHPLQPLLPISLISTLELDLIFIPCLVFGIENLVERNFQTFLILIFLFPTQQLHTSSILIFHYSVTSTNYEAIRCLIAFIPHFICSASSHFLEHCVLSDYLSSFKQSMKQINESNTLHY